MHTKFYILDCQNHYHKVLLCTRQKRFRFITLDSNNLTDDEKILLKSNTFTIDVDPVMLSYFLKELEYWDHMYWRIINYLKSHKQSVLLKVIPVDKGVLDFKGSVSDARV